MKARWQMPGSSGTGESAFLRAGFDVDEDVADGGDGGADLVFDVVGDGMAALHGHEGIDLHMHVGVVTMTDFADHAFFDALHTRHVGRGPPNFIDDVLAGRTVHQFAQGGAQQVPAVPGDDAGSDNGGDIVGGFITFAADQGDGDADGGAEGGDGIAAMMPGIGTHGGTIDGFGFLGNEAVEGFLDDDYEDQYREGEGFRSVAFTGKKFVGGIEGDAGSGEQQHGGDNGRGDGFGFTVTVGMVFIGRFLGNHHCAPDNDGAENIGEGFDGIGDQRVGMADDSGKQFPGSEQGIENHAEPGCAETAIEAFRCHGEM